MEPLLEKEQKLFDCIREYIFAHQHPPTVRELPGLFGRKSMKQVQDLLNQLREKGYVDWKDRQARTYRLLVGNMPLRGVIQAGYVVEQPSDLCSYIDVSGSQYQLTDYALRVAGESMIDSHICNDDFAIIRPIQDIKNLKLETIAAVWVEGEGATLKYVHQADGWIVLKAANREYKPQRYESSRVHIQGILVGLHRRYDT